MSENSPSELAQLPFTLAALRRGYRAKKFTVADVLREALRRARDPRFPNVWISLAGDDALAGAAAALDARDPADPALPLYGVPFAVKDNIDVAGVPTTCACRALDTPANAAGEHALVVTRLIAAGAVPIGKTNMDQFATGLVGTRSPYGACASVFSDAHISGGSSSGSAVAVAAGMAAFSLGTDTAGSGRVPAAFNNIVGLKPTRGALPTAGVFPACKSLDCVSIFANSTGDAGAVFAVGSGERTSDSGLPTLDSCVGSRESGVGSPSLTNGVRIGVPAAAQLEFFGDTAAAALFDAAVRRAAASGARIVEIDYAPFAAAAALLYSGPWVAERLAACGELLAAHADAFDPTVRAIIAGGAKFSAVDAYNGAYALAEHRAAAEREWAKMDVLLLPTTGTTYTRAEVAEQPVALNTRLGYYTNFVNLLDLAAVAVPAGFRPENGLPFGVTLIAPAGTDAALLDLASALQFPRVCGGPAAPSERITVAVAGAHLRGQPLNWQLQERGAVFLETVRTAPNYKLYALADGKKPGLLRTTGGAAPTTAAGDASPTSGIELELWSLDPEAFGTFVALIPPPLGIGTVELSDGRAVKGFICEPFALDPDREITRYGGWRAWLAERG
ncbi:MAG: allophanate hydrolase [Puniceicoccales bacterium]|jgi:allophanate hydrolase|nr:allophanate hydrolase [Puniceicoccales bacterium]